MRAQLRPRSSQVPSPSSGIRAPLAAMLGMAALALTFPRLAIPLRRLRRTDDARTRPRPSAAPRVIGPRPKPRIGYRRYECQSNANDDRAVPPLAGIRLGEHR